MKDNPHGCVGITSCTLPPDSHLELLAIRDVLLAMARATYGDTPEDSQCPVPNLTGAQLGHIFEHIAFQIHGVLLSAIPTDHVDEVPSSLH